MDINISHTRLKEGEIINNRYFIENTLGEGTFGIVYTVKLCSNSINDNKFALKLLKLWEVVPYERNKVKERFIREYNCTKIGSPYLVHGFEEGKISGNPYFVMEYCPGGSLLSKIGMPWELNLAEKLAIEILMGLKALHSQGIIHRDLKPANILFDSKGCARLTDFGIAGFLNARLTKTVFGRAKEVLGTDIYMPPEQFDRVKAFKMMGPITDIFAFGVVMFEVLTGSLPFGDCNDSYEEYFQRVRKGEHKDISKIRPDLPNNWIKTINLCISPDPSKRLSSVDEIFSLIGLNFQKQTQQICKICNYIIANLKTYRCPNCQSLIKNGHIGLRIMNGEEPNRFYDISSLFSKNIRIITIGRYEKDVFNDISIIENEDPPYISRYHATIEKSPNSDVLYIRDGQWRKLNDKFTWVDSRNGVLVNSKKVDNKGMPIFPGDIITIGDTTLRLEWKE